MLKEPGFLGLGLFLNVLNQTKICTDENNQNENLILQYRVRFTGRIVVLENNANRLSRILSNSLDTNIKPQLK